MGVNTSNRTLKSSAFPDCYHHESWGTGFDVGFVAGLNIRDYLAIQPGVFFETRGGNFLLMGSAADSAMPSAGSEWGPAPQLQHHDSGAGLVPIQPQRRH